MPSSRRVAARKPNAAIFRARLRCHLSSTARHYTRSPHELGFRTAARPTDLLAPRRPWPQRGTADNLEHPRFSRTWKRKQRMGAGARREGRTDGRGWTTGWTAIGEVRREKTGCRAKEQTNKRTNGPRSSLCDERRRKSRSLGFTNSSSRIKCDLVTKNEPDRQTYTNDLPSSRLICLHNSWTGTTTLQNGVRSGSRA